MIDLGTTVQTSPERVVLEKLLQFFEWNPNGGQKGPHGLETEEDCKKMIEEALG